jgi:hypothetical protein
VEYSTSGNIMKTIVEKVLSNAAGGIPFIGPFAADFIATVPTMLYEKYEKGNITRDHEDMSNELHRVGMNMIDSVIEEVSLEICRIYEFQLSVLSSPNDAERLGYYAATKIMGSADIMAKKGTRASFDRNGLLESLAHQEDDSFFSSMSKKLSGGNTLNTILFEDLSFGSSKPKSMKWDIEKIFEDVGLRVDDRGDSRFLIDPQRKSKKNRRYGFRAPILTWDYESKTYKQSEMDKKFTFDVGFDANDQMMNYNPFYRLIGQRELDEYIASLSKGTGRRSTFIAFVKSILDCRYDIQPVIRGLKFPKDADLSECDFSGVDLVKANLQNLDFRRSKFENANMIMCELSAVNFENSCLKCADMRWGLFSGVIMRGNTLLNQAKISYAVMDATTDLTDNMTLGSAEQIETKILTKLLNSTYLEKIAITEEKISMLIERLGKLEEERQEQAEKDKLLKKLSTEENPVIFNLPDPDEDFVGRQETLTAMKNYFSNFSTPNKVPVVVAQAADSVGKTELVLEFVKECKDTYGVEGFERVYMFNAENYDQICSSFRDLATRLKLPVEGRTDADTIKLTKNHINSNKMKRSLFVFENVTDREMIHDYLPKGQKSGDPHHVVIITRKEYEWPSHYFVVNLQTFTLEEACEYIRSRCFETDDEVIKSLALEFRSTPIALSQALTYMRENKKSIKQYLTIYESEHKEIAKYAKEAEKNTSKAQASPRKALGMTAKAESSRKLSRANSVESSGSDLTCMLLSDESSSAKKQFLTFSITFEDVLAVKPRANELLEICALLDMKIPSKLFLPLFYDSATEIMKCIAILSDNDLVDYDFDNDDCIVAISQQTQAMLKMKMKLKAGESGVVLQRACDLIISYLSKSDMTAQELHLRQDLIVPHILSLIKEYNETKDSLKLSTNTSEVMDNSMIQLQKILASIYDRNNDFDKTLSVLKSSLSIAQANGSSIVEATAIEAMIVTTQVSKSTYIAPRDPPESSRDLAFVVDEPILGMVSSVSAYHWFGMSF